MGHIKILLKFGIINLNAKDQTVNISRMEIAPMPYLNFMISCLPLGVELSSIKKQNPETSKEPTLKIKFE